MIKKKVKNLNSSQWYGHRNIIYFFHKEKSRIKKGQIWWSQLQSERLCQDNHSEYVKVHEIALRMIKSLWIKKAKRTWTCIYICVCASIWMHIKNEWKEAHDNNKDKKYLIYNKVIFLFIHFEQV